MVNLIVLSMPVLTLAALFCCWKAYALFTTWRSAAAAVMSTDYSEMEQFDDRWGLGTLRGWRPLTDGDNRRLIEESVLFEDQAGVRHRATVKRYTRRGRSPDGAFVLWYDPADPNRVTCFGPGRWLLLALLFAFAMATLLDTGMKLAHR